MTGVQTCALPISSARIQIYFIDNDDYFSRRAVLADESGVLFEDNDDRAIFFASGMLETVKKLRWSPTIVHCHGWFSAIVPMYLKRVFYDDPLFADVKIVVSLADDKFDGTLAADFKQKLEGEGIMDSAMSILGEPTYENLMRFASFSTNSFNNFLTIQMDSSSPSFLEKPSTKKYFSGNTP